MAVLLVDDSEDDRFLVTEHCKAFAFPVDLVAVCSLKEGEACFRKRSFDLVVLDLGLGETHGIESLNFAKQIFPNTPIVPLTGSDDEELLMDCLQSGAQDFLVKGRFNRVELEKAIRFSMVRHARLQELEHKTEELDFMLDTQEIGLLVLNDRDRVIYCNQAVCDIFGYTEKNLLGTRGAYLIPIPSEGVREVSYGSVSGTRKILEVRATDSEWRGRQERLVTVIDVSTRKEMERQAIEGEKLETVARVCFGVAHEFNNLLAMTRTKADFLETLCEMDPVWAAHVEDLQLACERGSGLVKQLMTFYGREEMGRREEGYLELGTFLRSWEPFLESTVGLECSIELILDTNPMYVRMSERNLSKVLSGIVSNARDSMDGKGCIRIRTTKRLSHDDDGGWSECAVISIVDEGCGIALADQMRIFEPFFTTKDTKAGRGLGLSVVNNIMREHGGQIEFESKEGWGSEFSVVLKCSEESVLQALEESPSEEPVAVNDSSASSDVEGEALTVLVVDDEPIIRFSVARLLEAENCKVHCAENAEQALLILEDVRRPCHVLLTDINMPGMDGLELASRARYLRENLGVVVMSGYGSSRVDEDWMASKKARFISKPFKREDLREVVLQFSGAHSK